MPYGIQPHKAVRNTVAETRPCPAGVVHPPVINPYPKTRCRVCPLGRVSRPPGGSDSEYRKRPQPNTFMVLAHAKAINALGCGRSLALLSLVEHLSHVGTRRVQLSMLPPRSASLGCHLAAGCHLSPSASSAICSSPSARTHAHTHTRTRQTRQRYPDPDHHLPETGGS